MNFDQYIANKQFISGEITSCKDCLRIDSSLIYFSFADYETQSQMQNKKNFKINKISHTNIWQQTQIELKLKTFNEVCAVNLKYEIGNCDNMNETIVSMTVVSNSDAMEKFPEVFVLRNLPIF